MDANLKSHLTVIVVVGITCFIQVSAAFGSLHDEPAVLVCPRHGGGRPGVSGVEREDARGGGVGHHVGEEAQAGGAGGQLATEHRQVDVVGFKRGREELGRRPMYVGEREARTSKYRRTCTYIIHRYT